MKRRLGRGLSILTAAMLAATAPGFQASAAFASGLRGSGGLGGRSRGLPSGMPKGAAVPKGFSTPTPIPGRPLGIQGMGQPQRFGVQAPGESSIPPASPTGLDKADVVVQANLAGLSGSSQGGGSSSPSGGAGKSGGSEEARRLGARFDGSSGGGVPGGPVVPELPAPGGDEFALRQQLLDEWRELRAQRKRLLKRREVVDYALNAHNFHAQDDSRNAASHNAKAERSRQALAALDARLDAIEAALAQRSRRIGELNARLGPIPAEVPAEAPAEDAGSLPLEWQLPGLSAPEIEPSPQAKAKFQLLSAIYRLDLKGFILRPREDKSVLALGRWTVREIAYARLGLSIAFDMEAGRIVAKRQDKELSPDELVKWLQVAEMATLAKPEVAAPGQDALSKAGERLHAWGVPPYVLNHSQNIETVSQGGKKRRVSLSPDVFFYAFQNGRAVATPAGMLLEQFLSKLPDAKSLTAIELSALAYLIDRQIFPWARYKPAAAQRMLDILYEQFAAGKLVSPLLSEPAGIDLSRSAVDLPGHLSASFESLQKELQTQAAAGSSSLDELEDLAQAVRFAWSALTSAGSQEGSFGGVTHRDGLSFLKRTAWAHARSLWSFLPLGETFRYLGMDGILREIVEKGIRGWPMVVADAGLADVTHPDLVKNVVDIDRAGRKIEPEELALLTERKKKLAFMAEGGAGSEGDDDFADPERAKAARQALGGESVKADSHATSVVTPMAFVAEALKTFAVSLDLPGFEGDDDLIPDGKDEGDYFYEQFAAAMDAAINVWGARFANFSWGGPSDVRIHDYIDRRNAEKGVSFNNAFGNAGEGFSQQTGPSRARASNTVAGEDAQGGRANFTSGGGFVELADGTLRFMPDIAAPAGYFGANGSLDPIPENRDISMVYLPGSGGKFVHARGTSFSSPIWVSILAALSAVAGYEAREALKARGLGQEEIESRVSGMVGQLIAAAREALFETAEMLPGVPAYYQGRGRVRPAKARAKLPEKVRAILG